MTDKAEAAPPAPRRKWKPKARRARKLRKVFVRGWPGGALRPMAFR